MPFLLLPDQQHQSTDECVDPALIIVAGPRVWNALPEETTAAPSLTIF